MLKKLIFIVVICGLLGGGAYAFYRAKKYEKEAAPTAVDISQVIHRTSVQTSSQISSENNPANSVVGNQRKTALQSQQKENLKVVNVAKIPSKLNLKMVFYPQAPFGNWDYPWQESCEEASVLLVANTYYQHSWTRKQFNDEILKIVTWEKAYFGAYEHTTVAQTAEMLNKYLKLRTKIYENPSYEEIRQILAKGHLIVMTFAGKEIGNPFYKNGGPNYHAMVIKGYEDSEKLITEDVGTMRGEDYVYRWKTLQNALHDYAEPIDNGGKKLIEVFPPEDL